MSNRRNDHGTSPGSHRLFFISFLAYHLLLRSKQAKPVRFRYLASSALPSISTTWQAMHTCMIWYLASRACTYRFCKLASRVRIAVYYFASSVQIRTCANFCTGSLGTHPKPRNHTSCELHVFAKRFFVFMLLL